MADIKTLLNACDEQFKKDMDAVSAIPGKYYWIERLFSADSIADEQSRASVGAQQTYGRCIEGVKANFAESQKMTTREAAQVAGSSVVLSKRAVGIGPCDTAATGDSKFSLGLPLSPSKK